MLFHQLLSLLKISPGTGMKGVDLAGNFSVSSPDQLLMQENNGKNYQKLSIYLDTKAICEEQWR